MDQLDAAAAKSAKREKIGHQGTFNANPLCCGGRRRHALHRRERRTRAPRAERTAEEIRDGMRRILVEEQIPWGVYGEASSFLIFQNPSRLPIDPATLRRAQARLQGPQGRAQSRSRLSPARRPARQRRRHHGRAGRPGARRRTARARLPTRSKAFRTAVRLV